MAAIPTSKCLHCKRLYIPAYAAQKYCSARCKKRYQNARALQRKRDMINLEMLGKIYDTK